jgi:Cupin superfamily protein
MIRDFASLLAPLSEQSFLKHFLGKKRLIVKTEEPQRAVPLLPWATINRIIEWDVLPVDRLSVMRASVELSPLMFRRQDGSQRLRAGQLQALLFQGTSLVINGIDALVPEIRQLADAIERRLAHYVGVNAYLSFSKGGAFKAHWDIHDVLVVQIHGSKRWRSYGTPVPFPIEYCSQDLPSEIVWEDVLEPGDLLYLPRGEVHEAILEDNPSVHLTVRIRPRRGLDFLSWLTKQATDDELFRMDLTRLGGEAALHLHETRLKARLHTLIDSSSLLAYLEADDRERSPRTLFSLGQVDLNEDTFVVPAPRRPHSLLAEDKEEAVVTIGGEQHRLSAPARLVLSTLLDRNEVRFRELVVALSASVSEETLRKAVIELVKRGLAALQHREPA